MSSSGAFTEAEIKAGIPSLVYGSCYEEDDQEYLRSKDPLYEYSPKSLQDYKDKVENERQIRNLSTQNYKSYEFVEALQNADNTLLVRDVFIKQLFIINIPHFVRNYARLEHLSQADVTVSLDIDLLVKLISNYYSRICRQRKPSVRLSPTRQFSFELQLRDLITTLTKTNNLAFESTNYVQKFLHKQFIIDFNEKELNEQATLCMRNILSCCRCHFLARQLRYGEAIKLLEHRAFLEHFEERNKDSSGFKNYRTDLQLDDLLPYSYTPPGKKLIKDWRTRHIDGAWRFLRGRDSDVLLKILDIPTNLQLHEYVELCFEVTEHIKELAARSLLSNFREQVSECSRVLEAYLADR